LKLSEKREKKVRQIGDPDRGGNQVTHLGKNLENPRSSFFCSYYEVCDFIKDN
jgi:hypothetical protein